MKIKDYLEKLSENNNFKQKGLFGKELKILEPYFEVIDELKGKKIEIIEEITNDISLKQETEPKLINVKGTETLGNEIKVYSIFLQNDNVIIRCTENSIKSVSKIQDIINEIKSSNYYKGDLSDLGNTIGIIIGKYISDDLGYELDDFIAGLKHGISLSDGTHQ